MYLENQLAAIGGYTFDKSVPTAAITTEKMLINPDFFGPLNEIEKKFVIDHEVMHLILKHHSRFDSSMATNIATDLAINSILQSRYCGNKNPKYIIPNLFLNGCFPSNYGLPEYKSADWYLAAISSHDYSSRLKQPTFGGELSKNLVMREGDAVGLYAADASFNKELERIIKKERYSFEELCKSLVGRASFHNDYGLVERFGRNRRYSSLLPSECFGEDDIKISKNKVLLYLDFSGSCVSMLPDFLNAAEQIPKRLFNIVKYKFSTKVVPFDSDIGGGTAFDILASHAYNYHRKYDMVWVFTDGHGTSIQLKDEEKWHWFLSTGGTMSYIPKKCNVHMLDAYRRKK